MKKSIGLKASKKPLRKEKPLTVKTRLSKVTKSPIAKLKKKADTLFSQTTRLRFADNEGEVQCITCPIRKHWKQMQCGHFMSRRFNSTRFEEMNVGPQCYGCNVMHQGRQYEFGLALDEWYGEGTANKMYKLAQIPHQFTKEELEEIISDCKEQIRFYESQYPTIVIKAA